MIIAVATRMVPSSGATCSALARVGLGPAAQVPVYLRHQVAELASSRVALREQADPTSWQVEHAALMASGDRMIDAGVVQPQPFGNGAW